MRVRAGGLLPDGGLEFGDSVGHLVGLQIGAAQIHMTDPAVVSGHELHGRPRRLHGLLRCALLDLHGRHRQHGRPVLRIELHFLFELGGRGLAIALQQKESVRVMDAGLVGELRQ